MQRFFGQSGSGSGCSLLDQSGSRFTLQLLGQSGGFRLQIFWPIRRWMEAAAISANQHSADMTPIPPVPPPPAPGTKWPLAESAPLSPARAVGPPGSPPRVHHGPSPEALQFWPFPAQRSGVTLCPTPWCCQNRPGHSLRKGLLIHQYFCQYCNSSERRTLLQFRKNKFYTMKILIKSQTPTVAEE